MTEPVNTYAKKLTWIECWAPDNEPIVFIIIPPSKPPKPSDVYAYEKRDNA